MDFSKFYQDHGHKMWLVLAGVGAVILFIEVASMIPTLIGHAILMLGIAGILYAADWHGWRWLADHRLQLGVAIIVAIGSAIVFTNGLLHGTILFFWDIVVVMCVFSVSAAIWPNAEVIAQRVRDVREGKADPLTALREAAGAGGAAIKGGVTATVQEGRGVKDHFGKRSGTAG